tara:strand:+ start:125 stop:295 length:171 start_codon:yes stop_codon:yes gene_type:complete
MYNLLEKGKDCFMGSQKRNVEMDQDIKLRALKYAKEFFLNKKKRIKIEECFCDLAG